MKFLKNNWFKIVVAICLFFTTILAGYYYVIFLPKDKQKKEDLLKKEELFSKKENCQKYKKQIESEIENKNDKYSTAILEGIYYSPIKNTCIYVYTEWRDNGVPLLKDLELKSISKSVIDVLSGDVIKSVYIDIKKPNQDNRAEKEADFDNYVESITRM